ncbi:MAG: S9 family peptidase, partial [Acidobacteriota bacterium]|nr:S9 family peptidase [Acidobacteriota bacterium]
MRTLAAFALALPLLAAPPFTIEQVLSAPFPSDMTASPKGDAVAWVQDAKGVRNIWVAREPEWQGAPVTRFSSDDGQEIGDLAWKADSSAVFFTRGGGLNGRGESPNPRNDPAGVKQEVWMAAAGEAHKVGDGHSPAPAPDGLSVAWISGGQIWSCLLSREARPAQLVHARGTASSLVWAPGEPRLAFASDRGDHGFIGVYDAAEKTLTFLDPSVNSDEHPAWSPDGSEVAFVRIPADRLAGLYGAKRTGQPWSIHVANAKTGQGREIFRAREGMGSVFWPIASARQLMWSADGRVVFPWEADGWLHLYSIVTAKGAGGAA